jgi:hypothetical protein
MSKFIKFLVLLIPLTSFLAYTQVQIKLGAKAEKHIFEGEVKEKNGKLLGNGCHHYSAIEKGTARIISSTEQTNANGVFKAKVEIYYPSKKIWVKKVANGGYSTFFPKTWSISKTKQEILKAYENKVKVPNTNNEYRAYCSQNIEIRMYLKDNGEIISAFPADWE